MLAPPGDRGYPVPMPNHRRRPVECKQCHRKATKTRVMSFRGLCPDCQEANITRAVVAMATRTGPEHERWLENMARAVNRETRGGWVPPPSAEKTL